MPGVPPAQYGYLGPEGTFTHQALLTLRAQRRDPLPFATVGGVLDAVRAGEISAGLVPIENSVEGGVTATIDNLTYGEPLAITREVLLPVRFTLFARPGTTLADVRSVVTHPVAHAQVRDWLAHHLPRADVVETSSTAAAAAEVADPESPHQAAVCARIAGEAHRLATLSEDIADNRDAVTRFVLVAPPGPPPPPTGSDKTTMVLFMRADHSGALLELLEQFASRGVNLCRIESRPTRTALGDYCFSVDAEGHVEDARVGEALMGLRRIGKDVIFLGSYPRADRADPEVGHGQADRDYESAARWLDRLRRG